MGSAKLGTRLLHRGAEAELLLSTIGAWKVVVKRRVKKSYRNAHLDTQIRRERTHKEAIALSEARRSGVRTPSLLGLDLPNYSLSMTFVEGEVVRDQLTHLPNTINSNLFQELGNQIGKLHGSGLIHGDLTTSNVIFAADRCAFLLDFGMSIHSLEPEERGVDLHLLQRSLTTSHPVHAKSCMRAVITGYKKTLGSAEAEKSIKKEVEIAKRGRYFALR